MKHKFLQSFFKQTLFIYLSEIFAKSFGFITTIFIAKFLGKEALGQLSYASSIVFLASIFTDLGYAPLAVKHFAQYGKTNKEVINPAFTLKFLSSIIIFVLMTIYLTIEGNIDFSSKALIFVLLLNLIVSSLSFPYQFALQGLRWFQYENILKIITSFLSFILLLIFLKVYPNIIVIGGGIALFVSFVNILFFYQLNRKLDFIKVNLVFKKDKIFSFFKECLPFSIAIIITLFHNKLDIIILKKFTGFLEVGIYTLAYKIIEVIRIIPDIIFRVTFPTFSSFFRNWDEKAETALFILTKYLLIISTSISLILAFYSNNFLTLLGKDYQDVGKILQVLCWILIPAFLYSVTSGIINAGPKPQINTIIQLFMSISYFVILFILIPKKGIWGIVYTLVFIEWLGLLIKIIYLKFKICNIKYMRLFSKIFLIAGISAIPIYLNRSFVSIMIFLVLYFILLFKTKTISKPEFLYFYKLAGSYGE